ncbi:MAG TPA: efflux RND transporter permease subunit, partial [Planctomycetes bacterium]|nr:efflux RND transporter permease subunit [Planctomycetota bacterium]
TPVVKFCLRNRYLTVAGAFALLIAVVGFVAGGRIDFTFMPHVESDMVLATAALPYGSPVELTRKVQKRLVDAAKEVLRENGGEKIAEGILSQVGNTFDVTHFLAKTQKGGHLTSVLVYLVPADKREISSAEFERQWREKIGRIPGLESLKFLSTAGPGAQADIDVELSHKDRKQLEAAARELAGILEGFDGVTEVDKGFSPGKPQLNLKVRPEASSLGLTSTDLGRQVRAAFFGAEALRQQRGRNEVRVYVRYPKKERRSEFDVEDFIFRTPGGGEIPLEEAAAVRRGRSYTTIQRADGKRVLDVTAKVVPGVTTADKVLADLKKNALPALMRKYDGLGYSLEGQNREEKESIESLKGGSILALLGIFALLAIPFKSYVQPVIIMVSIPFGVVGAVLGHILMGYDLSIISAMGIVALAGVVVNDSLVLVHAANSFRDTGRLSPFEAVARAGARRFRPIILTSLTTFFGLAPMIFETSVQARFLIPMAISLGFGILFSTFIALLLVPSLYLMVEDLKALFLDKKTGPEEEAS